MTGEGPDRLTRAVSLLTLAVVIGISTQVDLLGVNDAYIAMTLAIAIAVYQILAGIWENSKKLKAALEA